MARIQPGDCLSSETHGATMVMRLAQTYARAALSTVIKDFKSLVGSRFQS